MLSGSLFWRDGRCVLALALALALAFVLVFTTKAVCAEAEAGEAAFLAPALSGRPVLRLLYVANTRGALHPCPS